MLPRSVKDVLRGIAPTFVNEYRHRRFVLRAMGLPGEMTTGVRRSAVTLDHVEQCHYDLWPQALRKPPFDWALVDVGANAGDFSAAALELTSPAQLIAVEPQPGCQPALKAAVAKHPSPRVVAAAVGRTSGSIELNCTGDSKFASVLTPLPDIAGHYASGATVVQKKVTVPMVALDELLADVPRVGLLKIDVQGFELEALSGATEVLNRTTAVLMELNYRPHYQGAVTLDEVYRFMTAAGFALHGVSKPYADHGVPLWADAIFARG